MAKVTSFIQYLRGAANRIESRQVLAPLPPNRSRYAAAAMVFALLGLMSASLLIHERYSLLVQEDRKTLIPFERAIDKVERSLIDIDSDLRDYAESFDPAYLRAVPKDLRSFGVELERATRLSKDTGPPEEEQLSKLSELSQHWVNTVANPLYGSELAKKLPKIPWSDLETGKPFLTGSRAAIEAIRTLIAQRRESNQTLIGQVTRWMFVGVTLLGLLAVFCCGYLFDLARNLGVLYARAFEAFQLASGESSRLEAQLGFSLALIRHTPIGIGVLDISTCAVRYANAAFERLPFLKSGETLDRPIRDALLSAPASDAFLAAIRKAADRKVVEVLTQVEFKQSNETTPSFWNLRAIPFGQNEKNSENLLLLWEDVTPQTLSMLQLTQERAEALRTLSELQVILSNMSDGVIMTNSENEATVINPHARELMGTSQDLRLPQPLSVLGRDVSAQLDIRSWETRAASGERRANGPSRVSFTTGTSGRLVELVTTPIEKGPGKIGSVVGVLHDITEFKRAEKDKDDFLALASHELKTPLTVLIASCQMIGLALKTKDFSRIDLLYSKMTTQLARLKLLIAQLFDYASLQSDRFKIHVSKVDMRQLIGSVLEDSRVLFGQREVEIKVGPECLPALIDEVRIEEVINNLISNAIRYSPPMARIRFVARAVGKFARVEIEDQGIGIGKEDLSKLFGKFARGSNTGNVGGMGIGLYLSSEIIRAHGGRIWCESRGRNQGSTFIFELPLATMQ